jgi:hypothetical protein
MCGKAQVIRLLTIQLLPISSYFFCFSPNILQPVLINHQSSCSFFRVRDSFKHKATSSLISYGVEFIAPLQQNLLEYHPLSSVHESLFSIPCFKHSRLKQWGIHSSRLILEGRVTVTIHGAGLGTAERRGLSDALQQVRRPL